MIADSLPHAARYYALHPLFRTAFDYLRDFSPATPDGRHPIDGERLFALPQSYETAPASAKRFEAHRRYIDIQYLLSGEEVIYHASVTALEVAEPYTEERDVVFFHTPATASATVLRAGEFTIYFPHDGHQPGCVHARPLAVRKIVLKIAV